MTLIPSTAYHRAVAMSSSFATTMNIARRFPFIAMSALILVDFLLISDCIPASAAARASTKHDQAIEIVEGDILVDKKIKQLLVSPESGRSRRDVAKLNEHRWRRGIVPFIFSEDMSTALRVAITKGMDEFHEKTCIWFTHRKNEEDYVEFMPGDGCYSSVGRQGGKQVVSVGPGCTTRYTMLHELMHTIGFFHEQSRYDRDLYVRVLWWNLAEGAEKNFHTYPHGKVDTLGMPYDFNSLMHYKNKDFSKNYQDTIQAIDNPTKPLGNNRGFSPLDLKQIVRLYRCQKKKYQMRAAKCKDKAASVCLLFKAYSKYCYKFKSYTMAYCQRTCQYCKFKV